MEPHTAHLNTEAVGNTFAHRLLCRLGVRDAWVPDEPGQPPGEGRDWLWPAGMNCSAEVPPSLLPPWVGEQLLLAWQTLSLSFSTKLGGASARTARYDASMPALALDIEVHPREDSGT